MPSAFEMEDEADVQVATRPDAFTQRNQSNCEVQRFRFGGRRPRWNLGLVLSMEQRKGEPDKQERRKGGPEPGNSTS